MKKHLYQLSGLDRKEIVRFAFVGLFNTAFSYGVFFLVLKLGFNHWVANFFALSAGIFLGFRSGGIVVFRNPDSRLWKKFLMAWVFIYALISGLIGLFVNFGINPYFSGILALPFSAVLSFFIQKYFVFRR